jgi:oligoribonuclease NrnB/cAMP/cGMP phosphodiesterase (DHH superfamily)
MIFFHLSHTDLDGYGCQLISKKVFPNGFFYNANYGNEVQIRLKDILSSIQQYKSQKIFFLISDLNLTLDEAKTLDKEINKLQDNGFDIKLQLLDHHISGLQCANKYDWYFMDESRCATKILYDYFKQNFSSFEDTDKLNILVEAINDIDIWEENDEYFEFGKVLTRLINSTTEINATLFPDENREYRLALLQEAKILFFCKMGIFYWMKIYII